MMEIVSKSGIFVFATHSVTHIKDLCNKIHILKMVKLNTLVL